MGATKSNIVIDTFPISIATECPVGFSEKCLQKRITNLKYKGNSIDLDNLNINCVYLLNLYNNWIKKSQSNNAKINSLNYNQYPDIMVVYNVIATPKGKKMVYSADKLFINLDSIYKNNDETYYLSFNIKHKESVKDNTMIQNLVDTAGL